MVAQWTVGLGIGTLRQECSIWDSGSDVSMASYVWESWVGLREDAHS